MQPPTKRLATEAKLAEQIGLARDRSTHTGTQTASTISDFTEAAQDAVAAMLQAGTAVSLTYNDQSNTLTVSAEAGSGTGGGGGLDAEAVRDAIGIALIGVGSITVTPNDAADTITISTTATVNSTDAQLRDRATHTGTQAISTITGLQAALDGKAASTHLHTLAQLPVANSGQVSNSMLVRADDMRLSNERQPTQHTHAISEITGLQTALTNLTNTVATKVNTSTAGTRLDYGTSLPAPGNAGRIFVVIPS